MMIGRSQLGRRVPKPAIPLVSVTVKGTAPPLLVPCASAHDADATGSATPAAGRAGAAGAGCGATGSAELTGMPGSGRAMPIVDEMGSGAAPNAPGGGFGVKSTPYAFAISVR